MFKLKLLKMLESVLGYYFKLSTLTLGKFTKFRSVRELNGTDEENDTDQLIDTLGQY